MAVTWISASDTSRPSDPNADYAAAAASWVLYKLTAEKYPGIVSATEWYGAEGAPCWSCSAQFDADASIAGAIYNHSHAYVGNAYTSTRALRLRHTPVISVARVATSGGVSPSGDYRVSNRAYLVRTDRGCWNLNSGVEVTYSFGIRPPEMGIIAAQRLADEIILGMVGDEECAIPRNVENVTRQGLSYDMVDPNALLIEGRTGIYEIDLFLKAANPKNARKKPKVFSAHIPRGERYT